MSALFGNDEPVSISTDQKYRQCISSMVMFRRRSVLRKLTALFSSAFAVRITLHTWKKKGFSGILFWPISVTDSTFASFMFMFTSLCFLEAIIGESEVSSFRLEMRTKAMTVIVTAVPRTLVTC